MTKQQEKVNYFIIFLDTQRRFKEKEAEDKFEKNILQNGNILPFQQQ